MRLYYYTGPNRVEENLKNRRLKLSKFWAEGKLNDPFELAAYSLKNKTFRATHKNIAREFASRIGFVCLSKTRYSPLLWAHYAKNHEGVCLEIDVEYDPLFPVKYRRKRIFPDITLANHKKFITEKNVKKFMGTKSKDWSYEAEWRMPVDLENDAVQAEEDDLHFLPFQKRDGLQFLLKTIYVGYRCGLGIENLQAIVRDYRHEVDVIQTRPAFQTFRVVEQKSKDYWNMQRVPEGQQCPAEKALFGGDG